MGLKFYIPPLCPCMTIQQGDGSEMCVKCHGDIYACDCPLTHRANCPYREIDQTRPPL